MSGAQIEGLHKSETCDKDKESSLCILSAMPTRRATSGHSLKITGKLLNLLTEIPPPHYSGGMISDFNLLSQKISQLAELAQSLRRENADLRLSMAALAANNTDLTARMNEAHQRVSALLAQMPEVADAADPDDTNDSDDADSKEEAA